MRKIIEVIVYSNLWISLGAVGLSWLFYQLLEWEVNLNFLYFIFFSTLLTYTFQRFIKIIYQENSQGARMEFMKKNKVVTKFILLFSLIGTAIFCTCLSLNSIAILLALGVISFFYSYKFEMRTKKTNLRDISGIKIFLIALVWAGSCAIIPATEAKIFNLQIALTSLGFFFYIIGITIPFDIRDIDLDEPNKKTLPQVFGGKIAIFLALILVISSFVLITYPNFEIWQLGAGMLLTIVIIAASNKNRNELYFSFLTDGLLIVLPISFYLLKILYPTNI